jgi:deoxyhypusine synthase
MAVDIRKKLQPLEVLDLKKCRSVAKTVEQMEKCAIGARMTGEVAKSLTDLILKKEEIIVIYDGKKDTEIGKLIFKMAIKKKWFSQVFTPEEYANTKRRKKDIALVIGSFSERYESAIFRETKRAIFINLSNQFKSGQVRDGFFPDFVNADPRLIIPILYLTLEERIEKKTSRISELIKLWSKMGGPATQAADGFKTLQKMVTDPNCFVFGTFSGIMTVAKMGGIIAEMIDREWLNGISATGALICHGFVEGVGLKHFKYNPKFEDLEMASQKLNRITDSVEPEENLDHVEEVLDHILNRAIDGKKPVSPTQINSFIGKYLARKYPDGPSILRSAYLKKAPVFIPASVDSELGNDIYITNEKRLKKGRRPIVVDHEIDSRLLVKLVTGAKKVGIFSIGGGVPRNNVQNVAPLIEIMNARLNLNLPERMFSYGCRIDPTFPYLGNLSGCTYSEGGSWRKMDLKRGRFSEVQADAAMVLPFYARGLVDLSSQKK